MRLLKKMLLFIETIIIIVTMIFSYDDKIYAKTIDESQKPVRVGVLLYRFDDVFISLIRQSLEEIQKNNPNKVEFTFYDSKNDQSLQNETIDTLLKNNSVDVILLNVVDEKRAEEPINMIKEYNIPVVLFNREPYNIATIQSYGKSYYVGTDPPEAGILQGNILVNAWNKNKAAIDTNGDNILQYVMLMGQRDNKEAIARTQYSVSTINDDGIKTQELALSVCDWERSIAKSNFEQLFLYYGNKIEAIIANNDEMAIGAIEVLQKYGYNKGDDTKTIAVVGVDAIPEAQELIKKGEMTGSVLQDPSAIAEASYLIGMNLVNGKEPLDGTQYKFDQTGVAVRIPYKEYLG